MRGGRRQPRLLHDIVRVSLRRKAAQNAGVRRVLQKPGGPSRLTSRAAQIKLPEFLCSQTKLDLTLA